MANEHSADFKAFQKMITRIDRILDKVRPGSSLSSIAKSFYYTITLGGRDLWSMKELSPKDRRMNWFAFGFDHVDDGTQWVQPKACSDVRDRIFAILAFTTHGSSFKVDYRLNPFELLLESLWLEQPGDVWVHEAEKATCMTAYLLNITPLSIMMYSDRRRQMLRDPCSGKYVEIPGDVELLHLRSASSDLDSRRWLKVAAPGREDSSTLWHPWDVSGMRGVWRLDDLIGIPRKAHKRFALSFYHEVDAILVDAILVIAVSFDRSRPTEPASLDRNTILVNDDLTDDEFLDQRPKGCRAVGIYSATCTPKPMRVYYALLEIPVEGPKTRLSVRTATTVGSMRSRGSR